MIKKSQYMTQTHKKSKIQGKFLKITIDLHQVWFPPNIGPI